jgi:hypothetical protein
MHTRLTPHQRSNGRTAHATRPPRRASALIALATSLLALGMTSAALAGTYVIDQCPSAPEPNGDAGPWVVVGTPQSSKAACGAGAGDWVGPRASSLAAGSSEGVQVSVPSASTITIREAKVWWSVPRRMSGADDFAVAYANGALIGESATPAGWYGGPDVLVLPASTTALTLDDHCSNDDGGQPCVFGGSENPDLQLYGAELTLADSAAPGGRATGGGLAGAGTLSGTQSLSYAAEDSDSGVRLVQLLIDGRVLATTDYLAHCPYTGFQACPGSESDTIGWNTASVVDGQHTVQVVVQNAAQNTSTIYDGTISTENAPANTSAPTIDTTGQPVVGEALPTQPGTWSIPTGAGGLTVTYQWQRCDAAGHGCQTIPGAQSFSYTPTYSDVGDTLRVGVDAADNDGTSSATSDASGVVLASPDTLGPAPAPAPAPETGTSANPYTPSAPPITAVGAPNATIAEQAAFMHLGVSHVISRSFARRAFRIGGRLTDRQGSPIAAATIEVMQQIAGARAPTMLERARTSPSGAFAVDVPPGPSRRIDLAYEPNDGDPTRAATTSVVESVAAGVKLSISPRATGTRGTITLRGRVSGPIPRQGAIVELLVHYLGRWEPFRDPRTNTRGAFRVSYRFQGARGRFPFRAQIPGGQAGLPYAGGYSNSVSVSTR